MGGGMGGMPYATQPQQSRSIQLFMQINMAMQVVNQFMCSLKQSEPALMQIKSFLVQVIGVVENAAGSVVDFLDQAVNDFAAKASSASGSVVLREDCPAAKAQAELWERRKKALRTLFWALVVFVVWRLFQCRSKPALLPSKNVIGVPLQQQRRLNTLVLNHIPSGNRLVVGNKQASLQSMVRALPKL